MTSTTTTAALSDWPPASLFATDVWNARQLTESLEAAGSLDPVTLQIQMAALLFLGDTTACRHLWRRNSHSETLRAALEPWWNVGAAMMRTTDGVWPALAALPATAEASSSALIPVAQYAQDIAQAYRMRMLHPFVVQQNVPSFLVALLGFGSMPELEAFCQQHFGASKNKEPGLSVNQQAALLAFLESQFAL